MNTLMKSFKGSKPSKIILAAKKGETWDKDIYVRPYPRSKLSSWINEMQSGESVGSESVTTFFDSMAKFVGLCLCDETGTLMADDGKETVEFLLSFGLVLFIDRIDDRVKNQDDIEKFVRLPYLGHTPALGQEIEKDTKKRYFYVHSNPQSDLAESLRYIRVGINFSGPPDMLRAFAITSSVPQEGKSFCSCNLASSFALDGNRVLLVDADNRRPVLHTVFNMDNSMGLTNYLTSDVPLESVVRPTHIEGLDFVSTGPESPNPSELLGSQKMAEFIKHAKAQYDRVIVDAPPLIGIGDGLVLGRLIGHLILIIRSHTISRKVIRQVRERLQLHQIKVLGVILNCLDLEKDRYGYYRYHYHTYDRYYGKKATKKREKRLKKEASKRS